MDAETIAELLETAEKARARAAEDAVHRADLASALLALGIAYNDHGEFPDAIATVEEAVDIWRHISKIVVCDRQDHRISSRRLLEGLAHILLANYSIARPYVETTCDPSAAGTRNLIIVCSRMVGLPCCGSTTPVSEAPASHAELL